MNRLLGIRGLLPFMAMIFLNALVDLGHKIVIQNTVFKLYSGQQQIILTAIVNALILLPFIFLFTPAGFLSDRYRKERIMQISAAVAVVAAVLILLAYSQGHFELAFGLTLLLGIQSAIYSPAKYGYIRGLVGVNRLAEANAMVQALTIVAILLGTFVFSFIFETLLQGMVLEQAGLVMQQLRPVGYILIGLTLVQLILAYRLPDISREQVDRHFIVQDYLTGSYLKQNLSAISRHRVIWLSIIGLALFWGISQVVLAAFPAYAKDALNETNTLVIQGILACSGLGIIAGSVVAGRMSKNHIETGLIPIGAIGITIVLMVMTLFNTLTPLIVVFLLLGFFGGMFIVPLNSLVQYHASEDNLGTVLAGNNWVQNVAMSLFLLLTVAFAIQGLDSTGLIYLLAAVAFFGTLYCIRQLPHSLARIIVSLVFKQRYRIIVDGFDHLPSAGGVLLLGNHVSWIDWAVVQIACPRPLRFVMLRDIYNRPWLKPLFKAVGAIPIARGHSRDALQQVNQLLRNGEAVCLFPEGAISQDGQIAGFRNGFERALAGLDVPIVPFYLYGL